MLFASNWGGDSPTLSPNTLRSLDKHNIAARSGTTASNNQTGFSSMGSLVSGLRGTGKAWQGPQDLRHQYNNISTFDPCLTLTNLFFVFKFNTNATSQDIGFIGGTGNVLTLKTDSLNRLVARVAAVDYTATTQTIAAGAVYEVEILVKLGAAGTGAFEVRLGGYTVAGLSQIGVTVDGGQSINGCLHISNVAWSENAGGGGTNLVVGEPIWRGGTESFSTAHFMGGAAQGNIPHASDLLVAGGGFYDTWAKWAGDFGGAPDATYANKWEQLKESSFDSFAHYLQIAPGTTAKQSWTYAPFTEGVHPRIVSLFQHIICAGNGNIEIGFQFLRLAGTDYVDPTLVDIIPTGPGSEQWGWVAFSGSGWGGNSMSYSENPLTLEEWQADELGGIEGGLWISKYDGTAHAAEKYVTQAVLTVVWVEVLVEDAPEPPDLDALADCETCDPKTDAVFADSSETYDGRNTTTTQLQLTGGPPWTAGSTLTLLASAPTFVSGDVGNSFQVYLVDADGNITDSVIVDVLAFTADTLVSVEPRTDVPLALQDVPTAFWTKMVDNLSGLDHLEGETVVIVADGLRLPDDVVTGGALSLPADANGFDTYGIVHVGLPLEFNMRTLAIDQPGGGNSLADLRKLVTQVVVHVQCSKTFEAGGDESHLTEFKVNPLSAPLVFSTDKVKVSIGNRWNKNGQVHIRHSQPTPLSVLAITPVVEVGDR
jgi:hypothetical protein